MSVVAAAHCCRMIGAAATEPPVLRRLAVVSVVFDHAECAMVLSGPVVDLVKLKRLTKPTRESFAEPKETL